jgi:hypothetical protein
VPLYEFLLEFPDREEVRLSDRAVHVGETTTIQGRRWLVAERLAVDESEAERFRLRLAEAATD